ncbi:MAG: SAM-dependent methyltransferase [Clostridiales bacterium]|nr:SAM-dependent methyltransferase [Clostridiales bacterium]
MYIADRWQDFEVLDTGEGFKLERWGSVILARPDPQVIWPKGEPSLWGQTDAIYSRSKEGGGAWEYSRTLPDRWEVGYRGLRFFVRPTGFKHTGLFPEQAANWDFMRDKLSKKPGAKVLNLFAYTGGATLACMQAGAHVTHVDAARGMCQWARENRDLCGLKEEGSRFIVEDALNFIRREIRRGSRYDGIVMDPPSYGRGPTGEVWKLENELYTLVDTAAGLLSDSPLFFLINSYTTGFQPTVIRNILLKTLCGRHGGVARAKELVLPVTSGGLLPCGCTGRWEQE